MLTLQIEDIDLGFDALFERLTNLDGARVDAGLFEPEQAFKGAIHEYGLGGQKERPWLSIAADTNIPQFGDAWRDVVVAACDDTPVEPELREAGEVMAEAAILVIAEGRVGGDALADSTIARKGHGVKLVDSTDMITSITYEVHP